MSRDAERFAEATGKLHSIESHTEGQYLHEYEAALQTTDDSVRVITLSPELSDTEAATDAFERVTGQWYNANTHPSIVSIVERESTPWPWVAIDQPHELTLKWEQSRLTPADLATVVSETAEALRTLGLYNAVHGTLTPDDILVTRHGQETTAQLRGFGLEHAIRTAVGEFEPTPYTAPELLENPAQPTEQTDVYGLGAITYYALTGEPPVEGATLEQAIREGPVRPPSEHESESSPALDDVVMQALSSEPSTRQDSPYAFDQAFTTVFDPEAFTGPDETETATQPDAPESTRAEPADNDDNDSDSEATTATSGSAPPMWPLTLLLLFLALVAGALWYL